MQSETKITSALEVQRRKNIIKQGMKRKSMWKYEQRKAKKDMAEGRDYRSERSGNHDLERKEQKGMSRHCLGCVGYPRIVMPGRGRYRQIDRQIDRERGSL